MAAIGLISLFPADSLWAQATGRIEGKVVEPNGSPIAGVSVVLEGTPIVADTDAGGGFRLANVAPGSHTVSLHRLGYARHTVQVAVRPDRAAAIEVVMTPRPIEVQGLTVIGTPAELAETRARMAQIPGGVDLIEIEDLQRTRQANFHDILQLTPGVWAQPRFGAADESQLSIRGSGLRNNFHLRGVNLLVNGMPTAMRTGSPTSSR